MDSSQNKKLGNKNWLSHTDHSKNGKSGDCDSPVNEN